MRIIAKILRPSVLVALVTASIVFGLGYIGLFHTVHPHAPKIAPVAVSEIASDVRTYGGEGDRPGVQLSDDPAVSAGVCRTFVGSITITQCVPLYSPEGGVLDTPVQEDGSAGYSDGTTFDPDTRWFYERHNG